MFASKVHESLIKVGYGALSPMQSNFDATLNGFLQNVLTQKYIKNFFKHILIHLCLILFESDYFTYRPPGGGQVNKVGATKL